MRVALLHSFYSGDQPSGENVVVEQQAEALARAGATVLTVGRHTDAERELPGYPLRAAWRTLTNTGPDPTSRLEQFRPDVVHVHNTVPNLGTRWLGDWPGPVVHTLHNFRPLCANALLYRDGHQCTLCPDGRPWSAVQYRCYRSSAIASAPLAVRNSRGLDRNLLLTRADRLVTLSQFAADVYARYGVARDRLRVVANGVPNHHSGVRPGPRTPKYLFVGRLRAEKGVGELIAGWPARVRLDVVGDGPLLPALASAAPPDVRFLGSRSRTEARDRLADCTALVFPSRWPEPAVALVVVEALEAGVPIVTADTYPQTAELVAAGVARGVRSTAGGFDQADLAAALRWAHDGGLALRRRCRGLYEQHFSEQRWVSALTAVYEEAWHRA